MALIFCISKVAITEKYKRAEVTLLFKNFPPCFVESSAFHVCNFVTNYFALYHSLATNRWSCSTNIWTVEYGRSTCAFTSTIFPATSARFAKSESYSSRCRFKKPRAYMNASRAMLMHSRMMSAFTSHTNVFIAF